MLHSVFGQLQTVGFPDVVRVPREIDPATALDGYGRPRADHNVITNCSALERKGLHGIDNAGLGNSPYSPGRETRPRPL
jgi:hypothetical protein